MGAKSAGGAGVGALIGLALAPFTAGASIAFTAGAGALYGGAIGGVAGGYLDSKDAARKAESDQKRQMAALGSMLGTTSRPTIETGTTASEDEQRASQRRRMGRAATILTGPAGSLLGSGVGQVQNPKSTNGLG